MWLAEMLWLMCNFLLLYFFLCLAFEKNMDWVGRDSINSFLVKDAKGWVKPVLEKKSRPISKCLREKMNPKTLACRLLDVSDPDMRCKIRSCIVSLPIGYSFFLISFLVWSKPKKSPFCYVKHHLNRKFPKDVLSEELFFYGCDRESTNSSP